MTGDLIEPNVQHPISIPDEKHVGARAKYGDTDFFAMWFRIDAKTAEQNLTGHGQAGDRYFHLGRGSAGCFTNIFDAGNDQNWNTIADTLSKARVGEDQLYVGHITFIISEEIRAKIKIVLINFAQANGHIEICLGERCTCYTVKF